MMTSRPRIDSVGLAAGKKARLHGTALFLPYDQGLEHPGYVSKIAHYGGFNGIVLQIGLAEKFYWDYAGEPLLVSGGERDDDEAMMRKARQSMDAGATGLIFGRNVWQRPHDESRRFAESLREILAKYPSL